MRVVRIRKPRRTNGEEDVKREKRNVGTATGGRFILRPFLRSPRKEQAPDAPRKVDSSSCSREGFIPSFPGIRRRTKGELTLPFDFLSSVPRRQRHRSVRIQPNAARFRHEGGFKARALYLCDSSLLLSCEKHLFGIIVILSLAVTALSLIQKMAAPVLEAYTNYRASLFPPFRFISEAFLHLFPSSKLPAFIRKHSFMRDEFARNFLPQLTTYFIPTIPNFIYKLFY